MAPPRNRSRARPACGITRRPSRRSMKAGASRPRNLSWAPRPARPGGCTRGGPFVAPPAVLATALLAVNGHAHGAGAQFDDALHVLSAGMWAGGILALASLRPPDGWRGGEARTLLERFGRVAFIAFGITALTGLLRATEQLNAVGDLWTTTYGLVLSFKSAGVLVMLALSVLAWRRGLPAAGVEAGVAGGGARPPPPPRRLPPP